MSFHPSGNYLLSGSQDGIIKIYDLLEARPIYDLQGHKSAVTSVRFSSKGNYFASGSEGNEIFSVKLILKFHLYLSTFRQNGLHMEN